MIMMLMLMMVILMLLHVMMTASCYADESDDYYDHVIINHRVITHCVDKQIMRMGL